MQHAWSDEILTKCCSENVKRRDHLGGHGIDWRKTDQKETECEQMDWI